MLGKFFLDSHLSNNHITIDTSVKRGLNWNAGLILFEATHRRNGQVTKLSILKIIEAITYSGTV